jgi:hypothetical protein
MDWHDPKLALLFGALLGLALWTPALPWLLKSTGIANLIGLF